MDPTGENIYPKVYLYRRIVRAKVFIDLHYTEPIDLSNIAEEASFSKFHFIRLFKKIYGQTPHQYMTRVRIEKAKELLHTATAVSDVCYAVGLESITTFTGLFKRRVGISPAAYQLQQLRRTLETRNKPLNFVPHCFATSLLRGEVAGPA